MFTVAFTYSALQVGCQKKTDRVFLVVLYQHYISQLVVHLQHCGLYNAHVHYKTTSAPCLFSSDNLPAKRCSAIMNIINPHTYESSNAKMLFTDFLIISFTLFQAALTNQLQHGEVFFPPEVLTNCRTER